MGQRIKSFKKRLIFIKKVIDEKSHLIFMTEIEKTEIVAKAKPVYMLVNKLGLRDTEIPVRNKMLSKYKAFIYKNYDGGFRSATVYLHENEYYCNLFNPPSAGRFNSFSR